MMRGAGVHGTPRPGSGPLVGRRWHLSAGPCSEWELPRGSGTCGSLVGNKLKNSLSLAGGSRALSPHLPTCLLWGQGMAPEHPAAAGGRQLLTAPQCPRGPFPACALHPHKPANGRASAGGPHRPGGAPGSGSRAGYRAVVPWGGSPRLLSSGEWSTPRFTSDWRAGSAWEALMLGQKSPLPTPWNVRQKPCAVAQPEPRAAVPGLCASRTAVISTRAPPETGGAESRGGCGAQG